MILDIAFAILLVSGLLRGYRRGFLGQVIFVGGIVLGVMFAGNVVQSFGKSLEPQLERVPVDLRPATLHLGAIAVIAIAVWILGGLLFSRNRQRFFGSSGPSPVDRLAGATLGIGTAAVIICLVVAGLDELPKQIRSHEVVQGQIDQSMGVVWAKKMPVAPWILDIPEVQDAFAYAQTVIEKVKPSGKSSNTTLDTMADQLLK